eukprot:Em0562g4a
MGRGGGGAQSLASAYMYIYAFFATWITPGTQPIKAGPSTKIIHRAVASGKTPDEIPKFDIQPLTNLVLGAVTGPHSGLCDLQMEQPSPICESSDESDEVDDDTTEKPKPSTSKVIWNCDRCVAFDVHVQKIYVSVYRQVYTESDGLVAGISNWKGPIKQADGDSITLFDHKPDSSDHRCDPIADAYAVIARPNNAILAIASGCNSGAKSQQAARCAVRGHLGEHEWGLSVVSVGSISCFVWKNSTGTVHEVTSTTLHGVASMGSLGPSANGKPDLSSLVCSYVHVARNDVVFLATRGIYDNFDPFVLLDEANEEYSTMAASNHSQSVPFLTVQGKENRKLSVLSELLKKCRTHRKADHLSALALKEAVIGHVVAVTEEKRNFLEKNWQDMKYAEMLTDEEKAAQEKKILRLAEEYPGFLGHATITAYQVGQLTERASHDRTNLFLYSPTLDFETAEVEENRSADP